MKVRKEKPSFLQKLFKKKKSKAHVVKELEKKIHPDKGEKKVLEKSETSQREAPAKMMMDQELLF